MKRGVKTEQQTSVFFHLLGRPTLMPPGCIFLSVLNKADL